jgi:hypothetical protein
MWQKIRENSVAITLTGLLLLCTAMIVAGVIQWRHTKSVAKINEEHQAQLALQKTQFDEQLKSTTEETRRQIDALDKLLKDAIEKRSAEVFMTQEEVAKLNAEKVNLLAEAIAQKIQPNVPLPKTPEEAQRMQNEQVDKVSTRMAEKIQPILAEMSKDQNLTREQIDRYSQRISDQIGMVLTGEMARNQQLNSGLLASQSLARESLALSHELTALYLSSVKDQGVLNRLLMLPANIVRDASKLNIVSNAEKKKMEEQLVTKMNDIEKRLNEVQAQQPKK